VVDVQRALTLTVPPPQRRTDGSAHVIHSAVPVEHRAGALGATDDKLSSTHA
jgi:hypothetical protein